MYNRNIKDGDCIIRQREKGDAFYIVQTGVFSIFVARGESGIPQKVMEASKVSLTTTCCFELYT